MKGDVKGYKRGIDVRKQCGRLTLIAQNEDDADLLGKIASGIFYDDYDAARILGQLFNERERDETA